MRVWSRFVASPLTLAVMALLIVVGCAAPANNPPPAATGAAAQSAAPAEKGGQEEFGPYEVVANWPKPLPDEPDGVKHEGWTWGSVGAVYAETPDRIWIAQRGELPLPKGAKPWTPYSMLNPSQGNATGNGDGLSATCEPTAKRGWERRYHHVIFVVDRDGNMVQWWQQHDKLFGRQVRPWTSQDQDEPLRCRKARLAHRRSAARDSQVHLRRQARDDARHHGTARTRRRQAVRPADRHRVAARRHVLHQRRLRRHARREVRQGRQVPDGLGNGSRRIPPTRDRTSSTPCTASRSATTADSTSSIADTGAFRCSTRTGSSSTVQHGPLFTAVRAPDHDRSVSVGVRRRHEPHREVRPPGSLPVRVGPGPGGQPGQFNGPHSITTDQDGNLYLAEVFNGRVQKFRPKPGADPAKLVGQELRYKASTSN